MIPTAYHPIRTAMMGNVQERRFRHIHGEQTAYSWPTTRAYSQWKPRFGSYADNTAASEDEWFDWEKVVINGEMGGLDPDVCAGAMDRLCIFEDMLASILRDRTPIVDLAESYPSLSRTMENFRIENREIDRAFSGSLYIHLGDTGVQAIGEKTVTGAYVNAEHYPDGTVHGDIHFVSDDPNWERAPEISFYDTLLDHQDATVVTFAVKPGEEFRYHIDARDVNFGNENNAYVLLPIIKVGVDVALGNEHALSKETRTEVFHAGPSSDGAECRIDVMTVHPALELAWDGPAPKR